MDLSNLTSDDAKNYKTACDRCCACCIGGGPILRLADVHLVRQGKIPAKDLYTIRKGELMFDKDKLTMVPMATDLIKIKIHTDDLRCIYLDNGHDCEIYSTRPCECRAFKCWDKTEIEMRSQDEPLERKDLLGDVKGLWDLIEEHQKICSYTRMQELTDRLVQTKDDEALAEINKLISYDKSLRETMVEKGKVEPDMLPFLLGRPFTETMAMFNLKIEEKDGKYYLDVV